MAEFFKTRIENQEKLIPISVPSRNRKKSKKGSKIRKGVTFDDSKDEDSEEEQKGKNFSSSMARTDISWMSALP